MGVVGFGHVNLRAPRPLLEQLFQFYTGVVGLEPGPRPPFNRSGYWLYSAGHDIIHLIEASADEHRTTGISTTIDHIAFLCEGRAGYERRLQSAGIAYEVATVPLTGQLQLVLKDPAGNKVELNFSNAES